MFESKSKASEKQNASSMPASSSFSNENGLSDSDLMPRTGLAESAFFSQVITEPALTGMAPMGMGINSGTFSSRVGPAPMRIPSMSSGANGYAVQASRDDAASKAKKNASNYQKMRRYAGEKDFTASADYQVGGRNRGYQNNGIVQLGEGNQKLDVGNQWGDMSRAELKSEAARLKDMRHGDSNGTLPALNLKSNFINYGLEHNKFGNQYLENEEKVVDILGTMRKNPSMNDNFYNASYGTYYDDSTD